MLPVTGPEIHRASQYREAISRAAGSPYFRYSSLSRPIFRLTPSADPLSIPSSVGGLPAWPSPSPISNDMLGLADPAGCSFCSLRTSRLSPVSDPDRLTSTKELLNSQDEGPPDRVYDFALLWFGCPCWLSAVVWRALVDLDRIMPGLGCE